MAGSPEAEAAERSRNSAAEARRRRSCPACGHGEGSESFCISAAEAAQHFVLREEDARRHDELRAHIESLWKGDACSTVRCARCRCRYAVPFVAGDQAFYSLAYRRSGYPGNKWEYRKALAFIGALTQGRRKLLEVGAGDGRFVRMVSPSLVRREDVFATEFSEYGIAQLQKLGVRAESVDFRSLSQERLGGPVDLVCLFQVLEHLDDLDGVFRRLGELCGEGGHVLIATPSDAAIEFNERYGALLDMPPNHLTLWNRDAIAMLAGRHGFRVVEHSYEPRRWFANASQFLKYRFLRVAQRGGSLPNVIWSIKSTRLRNVLAALWLGCSLPGSAPSLLRLWKAGSGESQFAVLVRS
jgi:SAM-dependent methyltransferase